MKRQSEMMSSLRAKVEEMASTMNMSNFGMCKCNWDSRKSDGRGDATLKQTVGLDNHDMGRSLQKEIMKGKRRKIH